MKHDDDTTAERHQWIDLHVERDQLWAAAARVLHEREQLSVQRIKGPYNQDNWDNVTREIVRLNRHYNQLMRALEKIDDRLNILDARLSHI